MSPQKILLPINVLELRAIRLALLHFSSQVFHLSVLVCMDNVSVKAYLNNQGGSRSIALQKEANRLLKWAESHLISIRADQRSGEHSSQLAQQGVDPPRRMVVKARALHTDSTLSWASDGGPVCVQQQSLTPTFFHEVPGTWEGRDRCSDVRLASGPSLCISANPLISKLLRRIQYLRALVIVVTP